MTAALEHVLKQQNARHLPASISCGCLFKGSWLWLFQTGKPKFGRFPYFETNPTIFATWPMPKKEGAPSGSAWHCGSAIWDGRDAVKNTFDFLCGKSPPLRKKTYAFVGRQLGLYAKQTSRSQLIENQELPHLGTQAGQPRIGFFKEL